MDKRKLAQMASKAPKKSRTSAGLQGKCYTKWYAFMIFICLDKIIVLRKSLLRRK